MSTPLNSIQTAEKSILDLQGRQAYLGNGYTVSIGVTTSISAATETPILYLSNPAANSAGQPSGNPQQNIACFQNIRRLAINANGGIGIFRYYINPTGAISGGSTLTPVNTRTASTNTSKMTAKSLPTVGSSLFGTLLGIFYGNSSISDSASLFVLDPGQSIVVTASLSALGTVIGDFSWYEL